MKQTTYNVHAWIERITPPKEGEDEATHKEMFDFSSADHTTLHAAFQAGTQALIAGRLQRDQETKDMLEGRLGALQIIGHLMGGECCEESQEDAPEHNPFHAFPDAMPCGTPQQHASGLDQSPEVETKEGWDAAHYGNPDEDAPEGRPIVDVPLPTFTPEEVAGIAPDSPDLPPINPEVLGLVVANAEGVNAGGQAAPEPLPKREPIEEGDQRGHRYSCSKECADAGHTLTGSHTIHRATSEAEAAQILADAQPGESRVVVGEFATEDGTAPIRFDA